MPTIVIDTNVFMRDYRLMHMRFLLLVAASVQLKIAVPDVVLDEVFGNYDRNLRATMNSVRSDLAKLNIELTSDYDIEKRAAAYRTFLRAELDSSSVVIAPYPSLKMKDLVQRSYQGTKPFKINDSPKDSKSKEPKTETGLKDYLIWRTICNLPSEEDAEVLFITDNVKDFCDVDGSADKALQQEAQSAGKSVVVYKDVESLVEARIRPMLNAEPDVAESLRSDSIPGFSLAGTVVTVLEAHLENKPISAMDANVPPWMYDLFVDAVAAGPTIDKLEVSSLNEKNWLIEVEGADLCRIFGRVTRSRLGELTPDDLCTVDIAENFGDEFSFPVKTTTDVGYSMSLVYDHVDGTVVGQLVRTRRPKREPTSS